VDLVRAGFSEERIASIIRMKTISESEIRNTASFVLSCSHGVIIPQNTSFFIVTAVKAPNLHVTIGFWVVVRGRCARLETSMPFVNVGSSISHNPTGLHGHLREHLYF
jgi:hypothetical protein